MMAKITSTRVREVNVTWNSFGSHMKELSDIADSVSWGTHRKNQGDETDEQFLDRVANEIRDEFLTQAGEATGADGFAFSVSFADV